MKGILGIFMVIAVMYPPCAQAWGIPAVLTERIVADATPPSAVKTEKEALKAAKKAQKEAEKKARKAEKEARKRAKKNKKNKNAVPEGAIATCDEFISALSGRTPFFTVVDYDVALPMGTDEITYTVKLASATASGDPLSPVNYLIDWTLDHNGSETTGFLAYFNGNHYRYRDHRLQEYHIEEDSVPFRTRNGGVQTNAQFVNLIPQMIAKELRKMATSTDFTVSFTPDTISGGEHRVAFTAVQKINGETGQSYMIIADRFSGNPLEITNLYNPGQISEQTITARFTYPEGEQLKAVADEASLQELYPEEFEKYRDCSNRIEHMRGLRMPAFSLPTTTGERYTRQKEDPFSHPTVIAIIDPDAVNARQTIASLRKAIADSPQETNLILAFTGSNTDRIEELAGSPAVNETMLISARSLARSCGTAVFPTVLVTESSGKIGNVILGENNNMTQNVIQSLKLVY